MTSSGTVEETRAIVACLNARFYARLAAMGIVPPIGPDGPPPLVREVANRS